MKHLICAILFMFCQPVWAKSVEVTSGEHEGFTRIVLNFSAPVDWQFGRTTDGYAFRINGDAPTYDLSGLYNLIGKTRLAALWASPDDAALNIGFACACHAIPFEFRPGIIVIDLRDGPPPKGSSFEENLTMPAAAETSAPPPKVEGPQYNWVSKFQEKRTPLAPATPEAIVEVNTEAKTNENTGVNAKENAGMAPKPSSDPALQPLRDQLLRQLSRGAADGVVDMALADKKKPQEKKPGYAAARVGLGEMPGVLIDVPATLDEDLGDKGEVCAPESSLDFAAWGDETPISEQFSTAMSGILGEFDRPDPEAVLRAVHFLLFVGFGVESAQTLDAFIPDHPDKALLRSMAYIMDDEPDQQMFFSGQASCETPAALWSVLADPEIGEGSRVNVNAVILAFSNLPLQTRRYLGPRLAEKFLQMKDTASASTIQNAILRAGGDAGPEVAISQAKIDMAEGDPVAAEHQLADISSESGPIKAQALMEMVDALVAQSRPIDAKIAEELEALMAEMKGSESGHQIAGALVLAQASSGTFAQAFAGGAADPDLNKQVWKILALLGTDSDVLSQSVLPKDLIPTDLPMETAEKIIGRLADIGLPDVAETWVSIYSGTDPLLRSRVHLDGRDGRSALQAAQQVGGDQGKELAAQALLMLGNRDAAAREFAKLGAVDAELRAYATAGAWKKLAELPSNEWTALASALDVGQDSSVENLGGPLAMGQDLAVKSAQTRADIANLLAKIPPPSAP